MFILTAIKDDNELFTITRHVSREQLVSVRNNSMFTCPQCANPLRLKIGKVVTPHFAHIALSDCLTSFSERESPIHLLGKQHLAEFFTRLEWEVSVEAYLSQIAQRPDLLVRKGEECFAVEFQCSVISTAEIAKRNDGYNKIGIPAIWLFLSPKNLPDSSNSGISYLKLSPFMQSFVTRDAKSGPALVTYDPMNEQFVYFTHLVHMGGRSFVSKVRSLPLDDQIYPFAQVRSLTTEEGERYWRMFQEKRNRYLKNRLRSSKHGARDRFLRNCYHFGIRPENLPLFIGFPIQGSESIQDHLAEWQLALLSTLAQRNIEPNLFHCEEIDVFLERECKVFDASRAVETINRYCQLLIELEYDINLPIPQQQVNESEILEHFNDVLVAKRCEN